MTATPTYAQPPRKGPNGFVIGCLAAVVIAVLCVVGFVVAIFSLVMNLTAAPVAAADAFFTTCTAQGAAACYPMTATSYQSAHPAGDFEAVAARSNFTRVESESWSGRNVNNDTATLEGQLHYKGGGGDAVTVTLQKSGDAWKITSIEGPGVSGASSGG